ncbi:MAG TPA: PKD domain-containing protein [Solirubrobacterales bacterium]|nr:PKD domain-containing protein [Solirubrobacterales bacterium]
MRVDWNQSFEASQVRIAAGEGGQLLVVWVTPVGTVHEHLQSGLLSAELGPGSNGFGPSLLVDPDIGSGVGATPSLAGTEPGKAIVVYRVVTEDYSLPVPHPIPQLRPGDVLAEVRLARFSGDRWSRIAPVNRNPAASMRPPSEANAPRVALSADGSAAVAWQEPDRTGAARIWLRRIFGTTPGPPLEASPATWDGKPIAEDADAISLDETALAQVRVAMRVGGGPGSALGRPRLFLNSLPPGFSLTAGKLTGAEFADGGAGPPLGAPSVAAGDEGGGEGSLHLAFTAAGGIGEVGVGDDGKVTPIPLPPGPRVAPGGDAVAAVDPSGGGLAAWPSFDRQGRPALAVRQVLGSGAAQTGLVSGVQAGPVSGLAIGRLESGDALIGFRQGEAGSFEIVGERVGAAPSKLILQGPSRWVRPRRARLHWEGPRSAVGGLTYSVLLDGRVARGGLRRHRFRPRPAVLGSGVVRAQVLATDRLGQQLLSRPTKLRVDGQAPRVRVRVRRARGAVAIRIADSDSGLRRRATRVDFGDGVRSRGGTKFRHAYDRGGRYSVLIRARDRTGNRLARRLEVSVR